jgi:hypothetical protein
MMSECAPKTRKMDKVFSAEAYSALLKAIAVTDRYIQRLGEEVGHAPLKHVTFVQARLTTSPQGGARGRYKATTRQIISRLNEKDIARRRSVYRTFNRVFYQSDIQMSLEFATVGKASSATSTVLHALEQLLTEQIQYSRFEPRPSFM